jgi:dTDP-4-amino-4,6-dideoxygalactose transaminase
MLDLQAQYRAIRDELDAAVRDVVESQRFILGAPVERLEAELARRVGVPHAVGCASGTDALLLSMKALDLPPGSGVAVPSFTFFATAGAVWNAGLRPVFVDVDPDTFNVTAETLEPALEAGVAAVIPVHLFGQMAAMAPILERAAAQGAAVIEDAAQAIGAAQRQGGAWQEAGSLGTMGCFSFFPTKNLGGYGDGGLVTTGNEELAERLRKLRVHGGRQMYHHELVGTNSRLDALQAAVLLAKLPYLDGWAEARRRNAAAYGELLADVDAVITPVTLPDNLHVFNQYTIRVAGGQAARDGLKRHLEARGIGSAVYYPVPLHLQDCFRGLGYHAGDLPVTERLAGEVLSLPVHPELARGQVAEVAAGVRSFFQR